MAGLELETALSAEVDNMFRQSVATAPMPKPIQPVIPMAQITNVFELPNGDTVVRNSTDADVAFVKNSHAAHLAAREFVDELDAVDRAAQMMKERKKIKQPDAVVSPGVAAGVPETKMQKEKENKKQPAGADVVVDDVEKKAKIIAVEATKLRAEIKNIGINKNVNLSTFATGVGEIGRQLQEVSILAVAAGGHRRTWSRVMTAGHGLTSFATGMKTIKAAQPFSLDMALGYWGAAIGVLTTVFSLFGDEKDDDGLREMFAQVFSALQQIHESLERGFQRLETILVDCVCERLAHISHKLIRIESIMCASFQDLHRKDLLDIADSIKKDVRGEFLQTNTEKRALLRRLSTWIDCHCASSIEVAQNRIEIDSPTVLLEGLGDVSQCNPKESLGFLVPLITALVPKYKPLKATPNVAVCMYASDLFALAHQKWNLGDCHRVEALYGRVVATLEQVQASVDAIDRSIIDCLLRQVAHFRFLLGRALARVGIDFNQNRGGKKMKEQIAAAPIGERDNVLRVLDAMELRRLVLEQVSLIAPLDAAQRQQIASLQSKAQFLAQEPPKTAICQFAVAQHGKEHEILDCLNRGANVNASCGWGSMVLHFTRDNRIAVARGLDHMLRCEGVQLNNGSAHSRGDTWPVGSRPIQYILNCAQYELALLFVANGYDIDATNYGACWAGNHWGDCGNLYQWAATPTNYDSVICLAFVHAMADTTSFLHRDQLRAAYKFYKQYEAGLIVEEYRGNQKSLFTIVCLLGLIPQHPSVNFQFNFNAPILVGCGFTFYMLAFRCKNYNVMQYMIDSGNCRNHRQSLNPAHVTENVVVFPLADAAVPARLPVAAAPATEFLRYLETEKQRFTDLIAASLAANEEQQQQQRNSFSAQCRAWIELLEPICSATNHAMIGATFQALKTETRRVSLDTSSVIANFNLINAMLKQNERHYQLGPNIDLFLKGIQE